MKKVKDILFAAWLVILALGAIFGHVFTDEAETKFWWTTWEVIAYACIPLFIGSIWIKTRTKKNPMDK